MVKVGDLVSIRESSIFFGSKSDNPANEIGIVVEAGGNLIRVKWFTDDRGRLKRYPATEVYEEKDLYKIPHKLIKKGEQNDSYMIREKCKIINRRLHLKLLFNRHKSNPKKTMVLSSQSVRVLHSRKFKQIFNVIESKKNGIAYLEYKVNLDHMIYKVSDIELKKAVLDFKERKCEK